MIVNKYCYYTLKNRIKSNKKKTKFYKKIKLLQKLLLFVVTWLQLNAIIIIIILLCVV